MTDQPNERPFGFYSIGSRKTGDRRSRRTDMMLQQALVDLLEEKNLHDITVTELTERADLSRSTFYLHYNNLRELFRQLEDNLFQQFSDSLISSTGTPQHVLDISYDDNGDAHIPVLEFSCRFIAENIGLSLALLQNPGSQFLERVYDIGRESLFNYVRNFGTRVEQRTFEFYYAFVVKGLIGMIDTWVQQGLKEPVDSFIRLATAFTLHNMASFDEKRV